MSKHFDLGFLGGGQLARMSIQAAQRMGLRCLSLDADRHTPASENAEALRGSIYTELDVEALCARCKHITLENEFIPAAALRFGEGQTGATIIPSADALEIIQDKLTQRQAYAAAGVPTPRAVSLDDNAETARREIGFPMVLKARYGGYDGKGTRYARTEEELQTHRDLWADGGWLAEEFVPFKREVAVMVAIGNGEVVVYPTMETRQVNHVCDLVLPTDVDASEVALKAAQAMGSKGLFGVELFEHADGSFSVNEIAPRPHNTGHYTQDFGGPSQFEQHVRVAMGLPLAPIESFVPTAMVNLLGQENSGDFRQGIEAALKEVPGAHVHWYGKKIAKPGRKMGHINVNGADLESRATRARDAFYRGWTA